ncbi:MAG: sugar-specific transcriptional regulator TrmB [Methanocorpusculum sp.]|nr:sugar-specific transcriptional regulator TrmB [Methanocorpusculum sp.]
MRRKTFEAGYFTTADIAEEADVPRSTAQDWVNRLILEGCIFVKEEKRGRSPARYASRSAMPKSTCRRIFTTVDGDCVEIFHECLSSGCAGFCEFHHRNAGGAAVAVSRDGMMLKERAFLSSASPLHLDKAAVGLLSVALDGDEVVQTIQSIKGGPAYSLSSMMGAAKGVSGVSVSVKDGVVTGQVRTRALVPVTIGVDDTDRKGCGGATFALTHALMKYLTESGDAIAIRHQVAALSQDIEEMTAGNSCSFLELAVTPEAFPNLLHKVCRFVEDESVSEEWGVAILKGIFVPEEMEALAGEIRRGRVSLEKVQKTAEACGVQTFGGRGVIGACAAVSLKHQPQEVLLDSTSPMQK